MPSVANFQSCLWSFCVLYPVLPMSMDCPVLFVIVLCLVPSLANVYGLFMDPVLFVIALYLVPSVANVYGLSSLVCDRSVSCAMSTSVANVYGLSMDCPVLFVIVLCLVPSLANVYGLSSLVCNRSVSCAQCCQCLWIVQSSLWSLCILCPVLPMSMDCPVLFVIALYLVPSVANVYGLSSLVCNRSVSCAQYCQCLWIVHGLWSFCILYPVLPMSMNCSVSASLVCDRSVSCLWSLCILCPVLPMFMDCPVLFVIVLYLVSSVANVYGLFSLVCDRPVSCAQCCLCLWIVQSCLWSLCIVCPVLPMSMDCPVLFVIILYLVPSVAYISGLSSLDCLIDFL